MRVLCSCLDNGCCYWNTIYLECQSVIGALPVGKYREGCYPLKYPSNAYLSCLDNGSYCGNAII